MLSPPPQMELISEPLVLALGYLTSISVTVPVLDLRIPALDVLHAILINYLYRSALGNGYRHIGWAQGFLATVAMAAGGGCTVSVLRGEPFGILKTNEFWVIYGTVYWAMFAHSKVYEYTRMLFSYPLVEETFNVIDGILRNNAIVIFGVEGTSALLGSDKWVAQVVCGTLAGCGGGIWMDAFRLTHHQWFFSTPRLLQVSSPDMKATFVATAYYVLAIRTGFNNPAQAQVLSMALLCSGLVYSVRISRKQENSMKQKKQ